MIVIHIIGAATGLKTNNDGRYLKACDFDAVDGRGFIESTDKVEEAMKFPTRNDALRFYRTVSDTKPWRGDGRPNRPLTAFTVEILEEGQKPLLNNEHVSAASTADPRQGRT